MAQLVSGYVLDINIVGFGVVRVLVRSVRVISANIVLVPGEGTVAIQSHVNIYD